MRPAFTDSIEILICPFPIALMTTHESPVTDPSDTLMGQFKSLTKVFWIAGWMEIIERFSYYGARVALPVFMVAAIGSGGPELTQIEKGQIFGIWAVVQSFVPILSGGFADRYGYKVNIAIATCLKLLGYLCRHAACRSQSSRCRQRL
jgi:dipeptide/tripeptide permease